MRFVFHGAAQEVGRSCIEVYFDDRRHSRILFDAGLKIRQEREERPDYPTKIDYLHDVKGVFISHAHLDHSGALPLLNHEGLRCPIYATFMTMKTTEILLNDSLKIELLSKHAPKYSKRNIKKVMASFDCIEYNQLEKLDKDIKFKFLDAGHIPGSASILVEGHGKRILYTGDINTNDTCLLNGANYNLNNIDVIICESTYGARDHPPRSEVEKDFLDTVEKTIKSGGSVLVPAFAVGRAQEILLLLRQREFGVPIYLDGMAKKVTELYLDYDDWVKDPEALRDICNQIHTVHGYRERNNVVKNPGIFVTTAGMLDGGPVVQYLDHFLYDDKSAILLTGYQPVGTGGRRLLETGKIKTKTGTKKARCLYKRFDFSAHAGLADLIGLVKKIKPKHLILQHGDEEAVNTFFYKINSCKTYVAELDKEIVIR